MEFRKHTVDRRLLLGGRRQAALLRKRPRKRPFRLARSFKHGLGDIASRRLRLHERRTVGGTLTTRPLTFKGRYLFVNTDCPGGELKVEALDRQSNVIEQFTADNCVAISLDNTLAAVTWKNADDLSSLSGKPVRFRFHLSNGSLYAFWVSPDRSGASHGYVAAGGPGHAGPKDIEGAKALP